MRTADSCRATEPYAMLAAYRLPYRAPPAYALPLHARYDYLGTLRNSKNK
jgi:hypothetical protein